MADISCSPAPRPRAGLSVAAGLASIGAGTIHAAAAAAHADATPAMVSFTVLAVCQVGWGAVALGRSGDGLIVAGALGNLAVLGGWLMAKTLGIGFVRGLEHVEPARLADSLAAVLAALAVVCAVAARFSTGREAARPAPGPAVTSSLAVLIAAAAAAGVTATSGRAHGHSDRPARSHHDAGEHVEDVSARSEDRGRSIDLGDVDGVTADQQARAEKLVDVTRRRLPRFAEVATATAAGYVSIGDAASGYEHYVKWSYVNDDTILDPDHAETLVYRVDGDDRQLVSAMYMLSENRTLDTVPDVGGRLTQWHIHDDLCFTDDPTAPVVAAITTPDGRCPPPLTKRAQVPMLHVWIVPHRCGPFAALEGIAAGQVRDGEQPRCDHEHSGR
jgi:hypothetical protein